MFGSTKHQFEMQDPLKQYPQPRYGKETQPKPGLASEMNPKPDHGETSYKGLGRLEGRKALVTGGDSGIGRAAAIAFAREGADVAINYLPEEESDAQEVVALIEKAGRKAYPIPGDITSENFCRDLVAQAVKSLGGLDILCNVAGHMFAQESIEDLTTEAFDRTMKTNVYALFWICKAAVPHLKPGSTIINTASIQAYQPSPGLLDYAVTKAANVNFTKGLAQQLAPKGIRVNVVSPGPIWTPIQPTGGYPPEKIAEMGSSVAMKRAGQPAELASVYVLLASQESSYITGENFGITGGDPCP